MSYFGDVGFKVPFIDASGRLRMSQVSSLGDYKILNSDVQALLMEYAGTGSDTITTNKVSMAVTSGQYRIAQSKMYHPYLNGKSQFVTMTTDNMGNATNVEKSFGYISSDATGTFNTGLDGFRVYKDTSNVYAFEVWRGGTRLSQQLRSTWLDKLDGTGPSRMTIDFDKFNIFAHDFLYLGGTAISSYVFWKGAFRQFNIYYHANTSDGPMFNSPNKPIRWEIRSSTGSGNMSVICGEVATEGVIGDVLQYGNSLPIESNIAGITCAAAGTGYALCGVRKKTTARDVFAFVDTFEAMVGSADFCKLSLVLNGTVAGSPTYADVTNTPYQSFIGTASNTVTGGTVLASTDISQNMNNSKPIKNVLARLACTLNNTMDTIVLVATPAFTSTNVKVTGNMDVKWYT